MIIYFTLTLFIFLSLSSAQECKSEMKRMAYYVKNPEGSPGYFPVQEINASLITHLISSMAIDLSWTIKNPTLKNPQMAEEIKNFLSLRKNSPSLKLILLVYAKTLIPYIIKNQQQTKKFAGWLVEFLVKNNLDGVELTWQFPSASDKPNFVQLLKEIREEINRQSRPLLLSITVPANKMLTDTGFDVENINKYVDFVNLMAYSFHYYSITDEVTGHNSPLFKRKSDESHFATMNIKWQAESYVAKGMDKSKIVIMLPAFAEVWELEDENEHGLGAPAENRDPFTIDCYWQVCELLQNGYTSVYDEEGQAPYAYKGHIWISYDDERSFAAKTKWARENGYGGVSLFTYNADDHKQQCQKGKKFPLLTAAYNAVCK